MLAPFNKYRITKNKQIRINIQIQVEEVHRASEAKQVAPKTNLSSHRINFIVFINKIDFVKK